MTGNGLPPGNQHGQPPKVSENTTAIRPHAGTADESSRTAEAAQWYSYSRSKERWEMAADLEAAATQAMTILTFEEQARFLELHPAWSPLLNEDAEVVAMQGPSGVLFPLECIAAYTCYETRRLPAQRGASS